MSITDDPKREGEYDDSPYGPDDKRNDPPSGSAESRAELEERIEVLEKRLAAVYRCLDSIHVEAERMSVRQDALQGKAEIERVITPPNTDN